MKVHLKDFKIEYTQLLPQQFLQTIMQAQMGMNGHNYDPKTKVVTMPDVTPLLYVTSPFTITDYPVWLEVPISASTDIPSGLTFSTYEDESGNTINRTFEDFTVLKEGVDNKIIFLQNHTSTISKQDVQVFINEGIQVLSKPEMLSKLQNVEGEYYKDEEL